VCQGFPVDKSVDNFSTLNVVFRTTTRHNEGMNTEPETIKCATDECENMTSLHICDDCVEDLLPNYEARLERERGL